MQQRHSKDFLKNRFIRWSKEDVVHSPQLYKHLSYSLITRCRTLNTLPRRHHKTRVNGTIHHTTRQNLTLISYQRHQKGPLKNRFIREWPTQLYKHLSCSLTTSYKALNIIKQFLRQVMHVILMSNKITFKSSSACQ